MSYPSTRSGIFTHCHLRFPVYYLLNLPQFNVPANLLRYADDFLLCITNFWRFLLLVGQDIPIPPTKISWISIMYLLYLPQFDVLTNLLRYADDFLNRHNKRVLLLVDQVLPIPPKAIYFKILKFTFLHYLSQFDVNTNPLRYPDDVLKSIPNCWWFLQRVGQDITIPPTK